MDLTKSRFTHEKPERGGVPSAGLPGRFGTLQNRCASALDGYTSSLQGAQEHLVGMDNLDAMPS